MKNKIETISQSCYKDWVRYKTGNLCGYQFKAKWLDKTWKDDMSDKQQAGWWFEDILVRGESQYEEQRTKQGKVTALYGHLREHLPVADKLLKKQGVILASNEDKTRDRIRGKADIKVKGDVVKIIDIKTSGHVKNKFDFYGWGALQDEGTSVDKSPRYYSQLLDKLIQFKTYMYVHPDADIFEFWVFSSSDDSRVFFRLLREDYAQEIEMFGKVLNDTLDEINEEEFEPIPKYDACRYCKLQKTCEFFEDTPIPIILTK